MVQYVSRCGSYIDIISILGIAKCYVNSSLYKKTLVWGVSYQVCIVGMCDGVRVMGIYVWWSMNNRVSTNYKYNRNTQITDCELHIRTIPWFFSFNSDLVTGTNISIRSGTFLIILTAQSAACNVANQITVILRGSHDLPLQIWISWL